MYLKIIPELLHLINVRVAKNRPASERNGVLKIIRLFERGWKHTPKRNERTHRIMAIFFYSMSASGVQLKIFNSLSNAGLMPFITSGLGGYLYLYTNACVRLPVLHIDIYIQQYERVLRWPEFIERKLI